VGVYLSLRPGSSPEPPSVRLEVRQDGQLVGLAVPELPGPDANGRIAYMGEMPADRFPPGRYELLAVARQGAAEARQATSFAIVAASTRTSETIIDLRSVWPPPGLAAVPPPCGAARSQACRAVCAIPP